MKKEIVMTEESVKSSIEDVDEIINLMDRVNETFAYGIWIPSLKKDVMFREINTAQQKRLAKAIIDSPVYNTEFIFTLRQIIKENCVDKINTDDLTLFDKLMIALKMRNVSIGDIIEIEIPISDDGKETIKRGVSIDKIINDAKKKIKIPDDCSFESSDGSYKLDCSIPTIGTEYTLEMELREHSDISGIDTPDELRKTIGDAFINEIVKYINVLTIKTDDNIVTINLNDVSFRNRIAMIEKIPSKLIDKVIKYISDVKEELSNVTVLNLSYEKDGKTKKVKERLTIDGSFFTSS